MMMPVINPAVFIVATLVLAAFVVPSIFRVLARVERRMAGRRWAVEQRYWRMKEAQWRSSGSDRLDA